MAFAGVDDIATGLLAAAEISHNKSGFASQVGGLPTSLWRGTGFPTQGAIPGAAAVCNSALAGCFPLPARAGAQERILGYIETQFATQNSFLVCDRLAHMGGLSGIVTTAQTVNVDVSGTTDNMAARRGASDYSNVRWFLEWYTATGATAVNATCAVTYSDNSTGNIVVALTASVAAARLIEIVSTNGLGIKSVQSVTLSATTGTAGSFGVTAMRVLAAPPTAPVGLAATYDWAALGAQKIEDSACLFPCLIPVGSTSTGTTVGRLKIAVK